MTAPGAVTFERNRMMGSGVGMSYDKNNDILMLFVPIAVSFGLIIVVSGGVDRFMNLADIAIRDAATAAVTWIRSL